MRNIEELREAYEATPACIRRLFSEGDDWLEQALLVQDASLYEVPAWVAGICSVQVPSIECTPNKSPGYWRLHANGWESYYSSKELARMCK